MDVSLVEVGLVRVVGKTPVEAAEVVIAGVSGVLLGLKLEGVSLLRKNGEMVESARVAGEELMAASCAVDGFSRTRSLMMFSEPD